MSVTPLAETLTWLPVGAGRRSHAFTPGKFFWAYCGIGPAEEAGVAQGERCRSCQKRIAEIEDRELSTLGS